MVWGCRGHGKRVQGFVHHGIMGTAESANSLRQQIKHSSHLLVPTLSNRIQAVYARYWRCCITAFPGRRVGRKTAGPDGIVRQGNI